MLHYSGKVVPTEDEINEAASHDIDPDTFPRDSYVRLRQALSHDQIIDAIKKPEGVSEHGVGIPIEDFERALKNNRGEYEPAIAEANTYLGLYKDEILRHRSFINKNGYSIMQRRFDKDILDSDPQKNALNAIVDRMFSYHATCKNREQDDSRIQMPGVTNFDGEDYQGAHRWMLTQLSKLQPALVGKEDTPHFNPGYSYLSPEAYDSDANKLIDHYRAKILSGSLGTSNNVYALRSVNSNDIKNYVSNKRKLGVAITLGNSKFFPTDYYGVE